MLRYKLDDLGWLQFEALVQSLMKAELGLAVEAWGGHSDMGRDAYAQRGVVIPGSKKSAGGAVVFQAKFVQGANAAGARWTESLMKAVKQECELINKRIQARKWSRPDDYVFLTNCPVTATARKAIAKIMEATDPGMSVLVQGGADICGLLDKHVGLRRAFPEILALRDIDQFLREVVHGEVLSRSEAALKEARDLPPVFVPTGAYHKALRLLSKHGFVVLDGPPEMGKTAIARMASLQYLADGWDIIDCRGPDDVFKLLDKERRQLFVADDAFGRTEYDPTLGRIWERDLPRVMRIVDPHHKVIWTTRKHILLRALREMDLNGLAQVFPSPSEILVAADALTIEEKAKMLYRHGRAAGLSNTRANAVRRCARQVVLHDAFTPERIRRFVIEVLPELVPEAGVVSDDVLVLEVGEAIRNPTERMRKAFRRLQAEHVAVLIAMVNCENRPRVEVLCKVVLAMNADIGKSAVMSAVDDLVGGFLRLLTYSAKEETKEVDWIHPSYRDLVIEELSDQKSLRLNFLRSASLSGLKMAMAVAGGARGNREAPLLRDEESWRELGGRCSAIASGGAGVDLMELLTMLDSAAGQFDGGGPIGQWLSVAIREVFEIAVRRWSAEKHEVGNEELKMYCAMCRNISGLRRELPIEEIWKDALDALASCRSDLDRWPLAVERVALVIDVIDVGHPSFAGSDVYRRQRRQAELQVWDAAQVLVNNEWEFKEPTASRDLASLLENVAEILTSFTSTDAHSLTCSLIRDQAEAHSDYYSKSIDYDADDYDEDAPSGDTFDVDAIFEDL